MENITVADIMTREVISVKPNNSLLDCAKIFVRKRIGSLVVVDKKRLVGFISQRDILWALIKKSKKELSKIKVIDISRRKIATIKPSASLEEALKKMKKLKFRRLPVVKEKEIVGILTIRDIITYNPEIYPRKTENSFMTGFVKNVVQQIFYKKLMDDFYVILVQVCFNSNNRSLTAIL